MTQNPRLIAIGRSRYLYDSVKYLVSKGFKFDAIITDFAYEEYDIKHKDFEVLAGKIESRFFLTKNVSSPDIVELIKSNGINFAISVNWKYTIPKHFLDLFNYGIFNYHLGSLPEYKGNATLNWAIINGENHIYGNIHRMDAVLDAGDVVARERFEISSGTYVSEVLQAAESSAPFLFEKAIENIIKDPHHVEVKGTEKGLRCYPRLPEDSQINWSKSVHDIHKLIRASAEPFPGAYSYLNDEKLIIWRANIIIPKEKYLAIPGHIISINKTSGTVMVACQDGFLEIEEVGYNNSRIKPSDLINSIRIRFKIKDNVAQ